MSKISDIAGVILAGGRSTRFGPNKAFAPYGGMALIERVRKVLEPLFEGLWLVTNTPQEYRALPVRIVADLVPYQGPLGGIVTAFQASGADRIFVVGCDMPLLDPQVIRKVIAERKEFDAAVPVHDGIEEYLMAFYSRRPLEKMRRSLAEKRLSLREFFHRLPNVAWVPVEGFSWFNVNTPSDLKFLEQHNQAGKLRPVDEGKRRDSMTIFKTPRQDRGVLKTPYEAR